MAGKGAVAKDVEIKEAESERDLIMSCWKRYGHAHSDQECPR